MTQRGFTDAELVALYPRLVGFAFSLCGSAHRAEDLAHDAIEKMLFNYRRFTPGTSLVAWSFTILRNQFCTAYIRERGTCQKRKGKKQVRGLPIVVFSDAVPEQPVDRDPAHRLDLERTLEVLVEMNGDGEALLLLGSGFTLDEIAVEQGRSNNATRKRIWRARNELDAVFRIERDERRSYQANLRSAGAKAARQGGRS